MLRADAFLWNEIVFVGVCQAQNSEGVRVKQDRRAVNATWVSYFALVALVLLLFIVGGVSASKLRSWGKYPDLNPWSIGKPSERNGHKIVTGSDGALWSFGGSTSGRRSGELFKLDVETKQWTTITTSGVSPSARSGHAMGSTDGFLWVFGGVTASGEGDVLQCSQHAVFVACVRIVTCACRVGRTNDLWRLSLATLDWTSIEVAPGGSGPSARQRHVMTSVGLDLWLHGGDTETGEGDACATHLALLLLPR